MKGGRTKQQILNADETAFCCKQTPSGTFIAREDKSVSGFKVPEDRLTVVRDKHSWCLRLNPALI